MGDNQTITLPSGGTVTVLDFDDLRGRHQIAVEVAVNEAGYTSTGADNIAAALKLAELAVIAWTLPYLPDAPIPSQSPDVLGDLTPADSRTLLRAMKPGLSLLFPPDATPDDAQVPGSPTRPVDG